MRPICACTAIFLLGFTTTVNADMTIFENFDSGLMNSNLHVTSSYTGYGFMSGTLANTGGTRNYVRTNDSDYMNFSYELTLTHAAGNSGEIAFVGIGNGSPEGGFREPGFGSLMMRIHNPSLVGGRVDFQWADGAGGTTNDIFEIVGNITSIGSPTRLRFERSGDLVTMGYDANFTGVFTADVSRTYDLSQPQYSNIRNSLNSNTRMFFGSQFSASRFDDFSIMSAAVPEPVSATVGVLALAATTLVRRRRGV
jgi:hypothetical protein